MKMTRFATAMLVMLVVALGMQSSSATAQQSPTTTSVYSAYGYQALTVDNTAGGVQFSTTILNEAQALGRTIQMVQFRVACAASSPCSINTRWDGSAPTTTVGFQLNEGDIANLYGVQNIKFFRAIRTGANSAVLHVVYSYY